MKKQLISLLALCFIAYQLSAIDASVKYATFKGIAQENYVEIYVHINGKSVIFGRVDDPQNELYQAAVDLEINFLRNEKIIRTENYTIQSPQIKTARPSGIALIDMFRLPLANGEYTLEIEMADRHQTDNKTQLKAPVNMIYAGGIEVSDLQLLADFEATTDENQYVKHGYMLRPYTFDVYPSFVDKVMFYTEIYGTDIELKDRFLVRYYLQNEGAEGEPITGTMGFKKQEAAPVNVVLAQIDISTLPEGDYELVVEVRNAQNELLRSKAMKLHRSYPFADSEIQDFEKIDIAGSFVEMLDDERVNTAVRSLSPLLVKDETYELNQMLRKKDDLKKRQFLYYFWLRENEITPKEPYDEYMVTVDEVNRLFTNAMGKGYGTDRGRIYLKYGTPDEVISQQSKPSAPPYEVWFYIRTLNNQSNVKFVFYNPTLANGDFELLHSTARGEIFNPQWKKRLYSTLPTYGREALDGTGTPSHFGGQAGRIFDEW